jgi:hypothetical protein
MTDSNSPNNNKRSQLVLHPHSQQKKTRSDLQSDHTKHTSQDIWLRFQTMELIAANKDIPPHVTHTPIRELIKMDYRKNEAAELHTAKISYPRIPQ